MRGVVRPGDHVTAVFTIAASCRNVRVSLVSYMAPRHPLLGIKQRKRYQSQTGLFSADRPQTLAVVIPPCNFQIDFVRGPVVDDFFDDPGDTYRGRLINAAVGKGSVCPTASPTATNTPTRQHQ